MKGRFLPSGGGNVLIQGTPGPLTGLLGLSLLLRRALPCGPVPEGHPDNPQGHSWTLATAFQTGVLIRPFLSRHVTG